MAKAPEENKDKAPEQQVKVRWKSDGLKSSYANFCNATSTRTPQDMEIELEHRIVLSPFAAKRLNQLLSKLITEYETRYGELKQS